MADRDLCHPHSFKYEPLPDPCSDIRLLRISRSGDSGLLECSLELGSLWSEYRCLSYAWGEEDASHQVMLDGKKWMVRNNLWQFLQHSTHMWTTNDLFWIDAVCINQGDDYEKARQVAYMGKIFSNALEVIAWLGPSDERLNAAFDYLLGSAQVLKQEVTAMNSGLWCYESQQPHMKVESIRPVYDRYLQAFSALTQAAYWSRLWIVQEILLAKRVTFVSGTRKVSGNCLEDAMDWISNFTMAVDLEDQLDKVITSPCVKVLRRRIAFRTVQDSVLSSLVVSFWKNCCGNKLDTIFALLALDTAASKVIVPDYTLKPLDVFLQFIDTRPSEALISGFHLIRNMKLKVDDLPISYPVEDVCNLDFYDQTWSETLSEAGKIICVEGRTEPQLPTVNCRVMWRPLELQMLHANVAIDCGNDRLDILLGDVLAIFPETTMVALLRKSATSLERMTGIPDERLYEMKALLQIEVDDLNGIRSLPRRSGKHNPASSIPGRRLRMNLRWCSPGPASATYAQVVADEEPDQFVVQKSAHASASADGVVKVIPEGPPLFKEYSKLDPKLHRIEQTKGIVYAECHLNWPVLQILWRMMEEDDTIFQEYMFMGPFRSLHTL